jgi:hypothetical protein
MSRCVRREFVDHQFDGHGLSVSNANVFAINPHGNYPSYRSEIGWSQRSARLRGAIGTQDRHSAISHTGQEAGSAGKLSRGMRIAC